MQRIDTNIQQVKDTIQNVWIPELQNLESKGSLGYVFLDEFAYHSNGNDPNQGNAYSGYEWQDQSITPYLVAITPDNNDVEPH